ncbi:phage terminase large subunit family protein [Escherichia coli]|nr:phage terminase large subunit family protein [Escherichia coli]
MLNQETAKAARTDSGYILRAPRRMRVADAVAQYMRVPMGAGNSVPWDPLVAPYVIEPMNCLASREYDAVIFVGPARTGKTIGLIDGWVIYNVICDPADMLIIQMTEEKAREHSKKRLARTFRVSPEVVSRLSPNKNDNNVYDRTFLAGNYLKIGWPSVNIMSSSDYKCVALTDYDRFPEDIDGEGDAFSLASKRTTTFMSSGMTLVESSPGRDVKDVKWRRTSPHEAPPTTGILSLYNRGDRRRWYWPCPHCGEYFQPCGDVVAGFRDIADPVLASEAAYIQCPSCSGRILPEQKRELNGRGVWLRDGESINADGSRYGDPRRSRIASFWMEGPAAAYQTLSQLVYKLLTAEQEYETTGSEETLRAVINTDWGLPYLPRASMEQRKSELLEQRAEPVPSRSVPDGVNFLVATVDVQAGRHRRFVVQVTGYGSRGERWIIDRYNITQSLRGDSDGESQRIDPASYPEDWDVLLTDVFMKIYVIKIAVHGVSPMVWRRLRIAADTSLAALHFIFQIVQGWGDDHLHQFHIYGKDYGISYEGGIGFVDNPFRVVIDDFAFDAGDRFTYEYNFFEHWLHDIRVEAIYENSTLKAPFCISGHGMPGATAADEFDKTLAFLEAIVNADDETTVGEIRPFADDLDAVRFNRHKINRQLSRLDLASPVLEPEVIWLGRRR